MGGFFVSKVPEDIAQKPETSATAPHSSASEKPAEPAVRSETVREIFMRLVAGNPRFIPAKPSGKAFVIGGARAPKSNSGENNGPPEND